MTPYQCERCGSHDASHECPKGFMETFWHSFASTAGTLAGISTVVLVGLFVYWVLT